MDNPATVGGIIAAVVLPLVGGMIWLLKELLQTTLPSRERTYMEQAEKDRALYRELSDKTLALFTAGQTTLLEEIKDVNVSLQKHQDVLAMNQKTLERLLYASENHKP